MVSLARWGWDAPGRCLTGISGVTPCPVTGDIRTHTGLPAGAAQTQTDRDGPGRRGLIVSVALVDPWPLPDETLLLVNRSRGLLVVHTCLSSQLTSQRPGWPWLALSGAAPAKLEEYFL